MATNGRNMGRNGGVDATEFYELWKKFYELSEREGKLINEKLVKEQAKAVLGAAIRVTTVGQYEDGTVGGTLRRGWTTATHQEAYAKRNDSGSKDVSKTVENKPVLKQGKTYKIILRNNVEYASYVNYGHRTRGGKGFVAGQFFLEKALQQAGNKSRERMNKVLIKELRSRINGNS